MNKTVLQTLTLTIGFLPLLFNSIATAQTKPRQIELKVYSQNDRKQSCPSKVIVTEKPQPYREGGFATDGTVNLTALATKISRLRNNDFSVTWAGKLKPQYAKCSGSAGITKVDGANYDGTTNYLRMHFVKGQVYFSLDLAGGFDANGYPLVVVKNSLKNGNPTWTWGGTD
jgi:hypothetical protein